MYGQLKGETQSCVYISALLFTLGEVPQRACTSLLCTWSRPPRRSVAMAAMELDFGKASTEGYLAPDDLLWTHVNFSTSEIQQAFYCSWGYFDQEAE